MTFTRLSLNLRNPGARWPGGVKGPGFHRHTCHLDVSLSKAH